MEALEWGEFTVEGYSGNEAFIVCNYLMTDKQPREFAKIFLVNRIIRGATQLPPDTKFHIRIDISGQTEIKYEIEMMRAWKAEVLESISNRNNSIEVYIDFLN